MAYGNAVIDVDLGTGKIIEYPALTKVETARDLLDKARSVDEVKDIRDKAEALRVYLRQQRASLEAQNHCAEIKLRAERKAGELLKETPKNKGGRPEETPDMMSGVLEPATLEDMGISHKQSSRWQKVADIPEEVFEEYIEETKEEAEELTTVGLIRHMQESEHRDGDEWYTPQVYIEAARTLMGGIDLDPATCVEAQEIVKADDYFTKEQDGLNRDWCAKDGTSARIWCNPPYSTKAVQEFAAKIIKETERGNIKEGIILTNNCTDAGWFVDLAGRYPLMFSRGRVKFWYPDQKVFATRQGQTFFYIGNRPQSFYTIFSTTYDEKGKPIAYMPNWGIAQ